jgi:hypothetical protein
LEEERFQCSKQGGRDRIVGFMEQRSHFRSFGARLTDNADFPPVLLGHRPKNPLPVPTPRVFAQTLALLPTTSLMLANAVSTQRCNRRVQSPTLIRVIEVAEE